MAHPPAHRSALAYLCGGTDDPFRDGDLLEQDQIKAAAVLVPPARRNFPPLGFARRASPIEFRTVKVGGDPVAGLPSADLPFILTQPRHPERQFRAAEHPVLRTQTTA
jgi:hypothetical protein